MKPKARTPEELETLFEDAFVVRDREALAELFEDGAVLVAGDGVPEARGGEEIARSATALWERDHTYLRDLRLGNRRHDHRGGAMNQPKPLDPVAVRKDEGEARWWFAALTVIKATAADTGGHMTIVEQTEPPGAEAPLHVHHREDEAFWVLEGDISIRVGDTTIEASVGDYVFGPRDIPHSYKVGDAGCRMLFICTSGGFEDLVIAMSEPAGSRIPPPPLEEPPDMERIAAIAKSHGCELFL